MRPRRCSSHRHGCRRHSPSHRSRCRAHARPGVSPRRAQLARVRGARSRHRTRRAGALCARAARRFDLLLRDRPAPRSERSRPCRELPRSGAAREAGALDMRRLPHLPRRARPRSPSGSVPTTATPLAGRFDSEIVGERVHAPRARGRCHEEGRCRPSAPRTRRRRAVTPRAVASASISAAAIER